MNMKGLSKISYYQKYLGWFMTLLGIPMFIFSKASNADLMLLWGLFLLFTSRERIEDERTTTTKIVSLYAAFVLSYGLKMIWSQLFAQKIVAVELVDIDHFIIMVLSISLIVYHLNLYLSSRVRGNEEHN